MSMPARMPNRSRSPNPDHPRRPGRVDARNNAPAPAPAESIVTGSGIGLQRIAPRFTSTPTTSRSTALPCRAKQASPITGGDRHRPRDKAGTHILNNIMQNNVAGLFLSNNSTTDAALSSTTFFRITITTATTAGAASTPTQACSAASSPTSPSTPTLSLKNFGGAGTTTGFEAAIAFESNTAGSQIEIRITNNVFDSNGKAVLMWNASNVTISGNYITYDQDEGAAHCDSKAATSTSRSRATSFTTTPATAIRIDNKAVPTATQNLHHHRQQYLRQRPGWAKPAVIGQRGRCRRHPQRRPTTSGACHPAPAEMARARAMPSSGHTARPSHLTGWAAVPVFQRRSAVLGHALGDGARIQAEDFDHGGPNVAYYKMVPTTTAGDYRPYEDVDIEGTTDTAGGYDVFSTVRRILATPSISPRPALRIRFPRRQRPEHRGTFHIEVDGVNVTGPIAVPDTGGTHTWETFAKTGVNFRPAACDEARSWTPTALAVRSAILNWFQFTYTAPRPCRSADEPHRDAVSTSQINLIWTNTRPIRPALNIDRSTDGVNFTPWRRMSPQRPPMSTPNLTPSTDLLLPSRRPTRPATQPIQTWPARDDPAGRHRHADQSQRSFLGQRHRRLEPCRKTPHQRQSDHARRRDLHQRHWHPRRFQIVYNLAGAYNTFVSDVGIDDEEDGKGIGSVDFQVIGDGKVLFDSGILTNSSPTVHVAVDCHRRADH